MTTTRERYGDEFGGEQMWGLKELALPEPAALTPQTVGWLIVFLVVAVVFGIWLWRRRQAWLRDAWRRQALAELDAIDTDPARIRQLPFILRRCALQVAPRSRVASLRGDAWIDWLNASAGRELFVPGAASRLDELAYGPCAANDDVHDLDRRLVDGSRQWLRGRHAGI